MTPPFIGQLSCYDRYVDLSDAYSKMDKILENYMKLRNEILIKRCSHLVSMSVAVLLLMILLALV